MFTKMMICTDLTPESFSLINCASQLKGIGTREVILAHVKGMVTTTSAEEDSALLRQKEMLDEHFARVTVEVLHGALPAHVLYEASEKHDVGGILIGSHSKGHLALVSLQSVSVGLLGHTKRPLLLNRIDLMPQDGGCANIFGNILFPTDFSETAEKALDYLGKITLEQECQITLLHVISPREKDVGGARSEEDAQYLLDAKKRRLERLGATEVAIHLVHGEPALEIVARSNSGAFSMIVMGTQGKGILQRVFIGSTAETVAVHTDVPLLLIPGEHHME